MRKPEDDSSGFYFACYTQVNLKNRVFADNLNWSTVLKNSVFDFERSIEW